MNSVLVSIESGVELATTSFEPAGEPTGRDILLTHGLASNQQLWWAAAQQLAELGSRVVTYDQRGHGQSGKPDSGYDMATVADDLALLIDALALDQPLIGGQSWGGNVVLEAVHRHPERISGALLVDGGLIHLRRQFPEWEDCANALAPPPLLGRASSEIVSWVESMAADWPASGRKATLANFEHRPDGTIAPWLTFERHMTVLRGLWEHEPSMRYTEINAPVLAIVAAGDDHDRARKTAGVEEALAALPNGSAEWFQPAHHDVHAQKPHDVAATIHTFSRALSS